MLCMHWLILRREMQYMPTLKVKSSISETCLTRIKSANVWPHSQRWHARNDNTENEILIFSDLCGQNYFYTWATSFSEVICNKRQHWKWDFQFVRYIWPKLMYACIDSFSDVKCNICPHCKWSLQSLKLIWLELSLQMCDLILKGDMQGMTTLRMWSSISEICRTEIMLQISHLILRVDMHCMATLRMRFSFFQACVSRATSIQEPPHSQRWYAINDNTENEIFNLWDIYDQS